MGNASSATGEPVWPDCAGVRRDAPPLDCMPCADGRTPCEGNDRRRKHDPFSVAPLPSPSPGQNGRLTHSRVPRSAPWEDPPPLANGDWDSRRQESERRRRDYETIISDYRTQYTSSPSKPLPPKPLPPGPPAMQGQPGEWEVVVRVVEGRNLPTKRLTSCAWVIRGSVLALREMTTRSDPAYGVMKAAHNAFDLPLRHDHIVLGAQNNNEKSDAERGRSTSPVSLYRKLSPRRLSPTGRLSPVALRKMIGASGSNVPEGRELRKEESQNLSFASSDSGSNDYRIHHQFATQFIAAAANNSATWGETFNIVQVNPMLHFEDGFWRKTGVTAPGKQGMEPVNVMLALTVHLESVMHAITKADTFENRAHTVGHIFLVCKPGMTHRAWHPICYDDNHQVLGQDRRHVADVLLEVEYRRCAKG
eukprot:Tamp_15869.p1 GENE.Tamp_15869~~Tamp_15869.p1  ORF type:complete len:420 (+),score=23.76 Tamp_15869:133-1392(+)